jgi:hypothetical protein
MTEGEPTNDKELARRLGTNRKSLARWRKRFEKDEDFPAGRDFATWNRFIEDRNLGPYSARMHYGEALQSPASTPGNPAPRATAPASAQEKAKEQAVPVVDWTGRRSFLFDILEEAHKAYADGAIDLAEYNRIGAETISCIVELAGIWGVQIDSPSLVRSWQSIIATATLRKNEENKRARRSGQLTARP